VVLAFSEYKIDLNRLELRRGGQVVHLEPQVFDLLHHLVINRGRVVSKDELLDTIWNGRVVSEAALSSRINAARRAIGDDGERQVLIKTMHRRGFRFIGQVDDDAHEPTEVPSPAVDLRPATEARKPSIAVLPFANLSQESDTDYFSYGLTEDVIRLLARNRWLEVLSRHSAKEFLGRTADAREIGTILGIRYLVEGTVAKHRERVRITADLISADTGVHLWSVSYNVELARILDVQEWMAQRIAAVIEPELARLEREAAARRPPANLGAWDCYQRGLYHLWGFARPGIAEGEAMFRRAIELDPGFARAHAALAYVKLQGLVARNPEERPALLAEALRYGRTAVSLDSQDCMNLCVVGRILCFMHKHDEAIAYLEQSIKVNPSFAQAYFALGFTLIVSGRPREGIAHLERSVALSPYDPHLSSIYAVRALGHLALGELKTAECFARKATHVPNTNRWPLLVLASLLGQMDRQEDARRAIAALLERSPPGYSLADAMSEFFFCGDPALSTCYFEGLRKAGLSELVSPERRSALDAVVAGV
jgi:TolB-like protein